MYTWWNIVWNDRNLHFVNEIEWQIKMRQIVLKWMMITSDNGDGTIVIHTLLYEMQFVKWNYTNIDDITDLIMIDLMA